MNKAIENYLEHIYILSDNGRPIRPVDLANELGVTRASAFNALSILKEGGYVEQKMYGNVSLTQKGYEKAVELYTKHVAITRFLMFTLGVSIETAEEDACKIEHDISDETTQKLLEYMEKHHSK